MGGMGRWVGISETRDKKDGRRPARISKYLGTADETERRRKKENKSFPTIK
jgi:hypothetical protein